MVCCSDCSGCGDVHVIGDLIVYRHLTARMDSIPTVTII